MHLDQRERSQTATVKTVSPFNESQQKSRNIYLLVGGETTQDANLNTKGGNIAKATHGERSDRIRTFTNSTCLLEPNEILIRNEFVGNDLERKNFRHFQNIVVTSNPLVCSSE